MKPNVGLSDLKKIAWVDVKFYFDAQKSYKESYLGHNSFDKLEGYIGLYFNKNYETVI